MLEKEVSPLIYLSSSIPASSFHPPLFSARISSSCLSLPHIFPQTPSVILHLSLFLIFCSSFFLLQTLTKGEKEHAPPFNHRFVLPPLFFSLFLKITNLSLSVFLYIYICVPSHYFQLNKLLFSQQAGDKQSFPILFLCPRECWEVNIVTDTTGSWCCGHSGAPSQTSVGVRRNGRQTEGGRDVPAESENRDVVES